MADYQEYRRRILHRRWRRMFITAALLILLVLLAAVGVLWKRLHREPAPNTAQGPTILQQELTGSEWNTISYAPARRLSVQTLDNGMTAMDFRLAAQPASPAVERSSFSDVSFLGDSLTQGMQLYDTGLPNAHFCAYKGVGPNAVVNNTTCRRADGEKEVPMEALASQQPRALYILLGTNVLTADSDYTSFLTYYRLMLDMISQALPNTKIYVQSITPVRPEVSKKSPGLYKERLCEINDALSAIALEKGCTFLNLWEALADENGDLGPVYGHQWRSWPDYRGGTIDQIAQVEEMIKRNPNSRRMLVTAWNPAEVEDMALPPCHCLFQFYVADGRLSLQLYQRSADTFLGVPFNIASYALLLQMMAQVTGLQPGEFVHTTGDTHLYLNHLEQARLQLSRTPRPLPTMRINPDVKSIFDFRYEDFELENYDPWPHIAAEVSV